MRAVLQVACQFSNVLNCKKLLGKLVFLYFTQFEINVFLSTHVWFEHCKASDAGMPHQDDLLNWTHIVIVWHNIEPENYLEKKDGLKVKLMWLHQTKKYCSYEYTLLSKLLSCETLLYKFIYVKWTHFN